MKASAMQVCAEVAIVILDENTPASRSWFTWRDILHLVDIICCCAILFPIVWSIKHLREAAGVRYQPHAICPQSIRCKGCLLTFSPQQHCFYNPKWCLHVLIVTDIGACLRRQMGRQRAIC